jgi:hypothetical protein
MTESENEAFDTECPVRRKSIENLYIKERRLVAALSLVDGARMSADHVSLTIQRLHFAWKFADREYGYEQRMPSPEAYRQEGMSILATRRRFSNASRVYQAKLEAKIVPAKAERAARAYMQKQPEDLTKEERAASRRIRIIAPTWDDNVADALINCLENMLGRPIKYTRLGNGFSRNDDLAVLEAFFMIAVRCARERPATLRYKQVRCIGSAHWFARRLRTLARKRKGVQRIADLSLEPEDPIRPTDSDRKTD